MFKIFMEKFKGITDYNVLLLFITVGLITLTFDIKWLNSKKSYKDLKVAKIIGFSCLALGPLLFLLAKFI